MEKIASFQINHLILEKGMYTSRIDGDIVTYDIRMRRPNCGNYLGNAGLHTLEHLFATYVRSSRFSQNVVYAGPMGCRTGIYFLVRGISHADAIALVQETFAFIKDYNDEIPGTTAAECGNYLEHSLADAKSYSAEMCAVLQNYTEEKLQYTE